uniref:Ribonuclease E n=1 Tax=Taenioma perpusillum TaxID=210852 RepID=A0A1Z1MQT0_9FLOR|nr:ribonuclease E [Taenioma perpusillum]ARW68428.1 ribonuclease E [Taenioma perpusillum]
MVKKIIISYFSNIAAILNNDKIEEIIVANQEYQVNDIYIGVVHKIFSSINAAFIKLGRYGKSGFIHISDIKFLKRGRQTYNVSNILTVNQFILVQVIKEPTLNKGPRLTSNIHLHGRYLVLMPFCNTISISYKVYDESEKMYLYSLALLIKPENMGLLIKSYAQGIKEKVIIQDLYALQKEWFFIEKTFIQSSYPGLIYKDEDLVKKIVRDSYELEIKKIIVDSDYALRKLYYYLNKYNIINSRIDTKLQLYNKSNCILEQFNINKFIKEALQPKVNLFLGGYIVIESYEALTVIDVNSGSFNKSDSSRETILRTNFYAAIEISYQLKVRNINGTIIVDFIDMYSQKDQLQLLEHFNRLLLYDSARPQIIQLSELGFVELTRRRRGQSLQEVFNNTHTNYPSFYLNKQLSDNYYYKVNNSQKLLTDNKKICNLFFNKKFCSNTILKKKIFYIDNILYDKYFLFLDKKYPVYYFNPRANYILPVFFLHKFDSLIKQIKKIDISKSIYRIYS